jgi:hypothetical protein
MPVEGAAPVVVVVELGGGVDDGGAPWKGPGPGLGPLRAARAAWAAASAAVEVVVVGGGEPRNLKGLTEPTLDGGRRSAETGVSIHTSAARATLTMTIIVRRGDRRAPLRRLGLPDSDIR